MEQNPKYKSAGTSVSPQWAGDLSGDCSARWRGLKLTAQKMEDDSWSWIVYDMRSFEKMQADSSRNYAQTGTSGDTARKAAEEAARIYLETGKIKKPEPKRFDLLIFTISSLAFVVFTILIFPAEDANINSGQWNIENIIPTGIFYFLLGPALFLLQHIFPGEPGFRTFAFMLFLNSMFYGLVTERVIFFVKKKKKPEKLTIVSIFQKDVLS